MKTNPKDSSSSAECGKVFQFFQEKIESFRFLKEYRKNPQDFTRQSTLSFPTLLYYQLNLIKGSTSDELDRFFQVKTRSLIPVHMVTTSAYSQARYKYSHQAFQELNEDLLEKIQSSFHLKRWKGFRLLAIDGSTLRLPKSPALMVAFGGQSNGQKDSFSCLAQISQCFDVLNYLTIDASILPLYTSERHQAAEHLLKLGPQDLVLLDRGYPAYWLLYLFGQQACQFCARVKLNWNLQTQAFLDSGMLDSIIHFGTTRKAPELEKLGLEYKKLCLRLIRLTLPSGETEVLVTSLLDKDRYPRKLFLSLYRNRWPIEEDYKMMKCRLQVEQFSGLKPEAILQDFYAKLFVKNLLYLLILIAQAKLDDRAKKRTREKMRYYQYKINQTQALSKLKDSILFLLDHPPPQLLNDFIELLLHSINPVRPDRLANRSKRCYIPPAVSSYKAVR